PSCFGSGKRSARESNSVPLLTREACSQHTRGPSSRASRPTRVVPEGVEPPFPLCKRGVVAIGPRDVAFPLTSFPSFPVARAGVHPRDVSLSAWPLCQLASRAVLWPRVDRIAAPRAELGARESNPGSRAHEPRLSPSPPAKSQAPVSIRAGRPYETRWGTCH